MARITGYDGGDGEDQLLAALKQGVATEARDAWSRIRDKDMWIGSIVEICVARGYVKKSRLTFAGYFYHKVGYAETYIRQCWQCWRKRRDFDHVRDWVTANNSFKPAKLSGPIMFLDSHKAWSDRLKSDAAKKKPQRKRTAKEWRQLAEAYRSMLDRSGGVIVRWADEDGRDARDWNVIVQERAALEAEYLETAGDFNFPVTATRPGDDEEVEQEDAATADDDGEQVEEHPGAGASRDNVPVSGQYPGVGFTLVGEIGVPPRHPPRPEKPLLRLEHCILREPDAVKLLKDIAANARLRVEPPEVVNTPVVTVSSQPDPATLLLQSDIGHGEQFDMEMLYQLGRWPNRPGRPGRDNALCNRKRASFYLVCGKYLSGEQVSAARKLAKKFWLGATTVADVLARLALTAKPKGE